MTADLAPIWTACRPSCDSAVPEATYDIWLAPLRRGGIDGDGLVARGAPPSCARWVADRFARVLGRAAAVLGARQRRVRRARSTAPRRRAARPRRRRPTRRPPTRRGLNPKLTFEQFVIGDANRFAHAAALAVAELPGRPTTRSSSTGRPASARPTCSTPSATTCAPTAAG